MSDHYIADRIKMSVVKKGQEMFSENDKINFAGAGGFKYITNTSMSYCRFSIYIHLVNSIFTIDNPTIFIYWIGLSMK